MFDTKTENPANRPRCLVSRNEVGLNIYGAVNSDFFKKKQIPMSILMSYTSVKELKALKVSVYYFIISIVHNLYDI